MEICFNDCIFQNRLSLPLLWSPGTKGSICRSMSVFFFVTMILAMLITLGVLFTGLFSMARGGEFNRKYSNKLMRYRIVAQGIALLLFALAILSAKGS